MRNSIIVVGVILGLGFIVGTSAGHADCKDESKFQVISKAELTSLVEKKSVFVIDVNSDESFKKEHVPGAVHFETEKTLATVLPAQKDALIVAYCGGPQCTAWIKAATAACKMGYTHIRHFKDGIKGWMKKS